MALRGDLGPRLVGVLQKQVGREEERKGNAKYSKTGQ